MKAIAYLAINERFLDLPYSIAGRVIDPLSGTLSWQGKNQHLRRKELEVLALLASAEGKQVSRENFIAVVWQGNDLVGDRGLTNTIVFLRRSLRDDDANHPLIRTIPRKGYQLSEPAADCQAPARADFGIGKDIVGSPGWRFLRRLGESAIGETWLAEPSAYSSENESSDRRVFRFCRSEQHLRRLQREITLLRYVSRSLAERSDFLQIRDWQLDEPPYFLARDYARLGSLRDWAAAAGGLSQVPLQRRIAFMRTAAGAMAAIHALDVVHQQFGADSVFVDGAEADPQLKISAFSLGAVLDRRKLDRLDITAAGLSLTPDESADHAQPNVEDDVHALGLLCLQLALGDLSADSEHLERIAEPALKIQIAACLGPALGRPTAANLHRQLGSTGSGLESNEQLPEPEGAALAAAGSAPFSPVEQASWAQGAPQIVAKQLELIGNYRLLERLGEGGMGTVYLAEQREPVYRKVALKVIRAGLDGKQILARFDAERQALALMNHANVATVLESGLSEDGRPFFAMEYVAGSEITTHCDRSQLCLEKRIALFLQVCDGVLHAHQKGVLHRDLKPSNLLVGTSQHQASVVKVIDFGLAKSFHGKLVAQTLHTHFGAIMGTPVYSSPEQITGASSVDTRSDIYSLGVVLYELLAGVTPIASASLENLEPEKVREIVCKSALPSMRQQFSQAPPALRNEIAQNRELSHLDLPKTLDGDLSWVVGKCLERDPDDRYASVLELKKDLARWLELRPVEARPTSAWYRFRKLVRRNRGASILIAASTAALVISTAAAVTSYFRAESALKQAQASALEARRAAEFQRQQLRQVDVVSMASGLRADQQKVLVGLVQTDPTLQPVAAALTNAIDQVDFVDLSRKRMEQNYFLPAIALAKRDFANFPQLRAELLQGIATAAREMGVLTIARQTQQEVLKLRVEQNGALHPVSLESLFQSGLMNQAEGQFLAARSDLDTAYSGYLAALGAKVPETLRVALALISVKNELYESEQVAFAQQTLAAHLATYGKSDIRSIEAHRLLGDAYTLAGRYREGLEELQIALSLASKSADGLLMANVHASIATHFHWQRKFLLKLPHQELAASEYARLLGPQHVLALTAARFLAQDYWRLGRLDDAARILTPVTDTIRSAYGVNDSQSLAAVHGQALIAMSRGKIRETLPMLRHARERSAEQGSVNRGVNDKSFVLALIDALTELGEFEEAQALIPELNDGAAGPFGTGRIDKLQRLAAIQQARGESTSAVNTLRAALQEAEATVAAKLGLADIVRSALAEALYADGKIAEARAMLENVLQGQEQRPHDTQSHKSMTLGRLAAVVLAQGETAAALDLSRRALLTADHFMNSQDSRRTRLLTIDTQVQIAAGNNEEAEASFIAAWQSIQRSGLGPQYRKALFQSCEGMRRAGLLLKPPEKVCTG